MRDLYQNVREYLEQHRSDLLSILFLAAWPLVYYWQAALRQVVFFFGDIFLFFYPTHLAYAEAIRQGRLSLWEPRMLAGFPLYAEGQIGALYPTHPFLYGLLPIDVATNYDILLHLSWVAVGMYLFLRALKLHPASACLGALAFGFGGFFIARLQHMSVLATASWLPWLLWVWEHHESAETIKLRWRWFGLLALFIAFQLLGGHPQFAFLSVLLLSLYSMINWQRGKTGNIPTAIDRRLFAFLPRISALDRMQVELTRRLPRFFEYFDLPRVILIGFAAILGASLAAAQILPTYELSTISNRAAGLLPKFFNAFSLRLPHYLMLFNPFLFGNPYPQISVEVIGYIGFSSVILAIGAPFVRRDRRVTFFLLIALIALFLGLGDQNVFYRGLRYLPLFNYFRVPSRFFYWYSFAAAILAAITFDYLLLRARESTRLTRAQKIAMLVSTVVIAGIVGFVPVSSLDALLSTWVWLPLAMAFTIAWIILCARRVLFSRTMLATLVLALTICDLAMFAAVYSKTYDATTSVEDFNRPPSTLAVLKGLSPQEGRILTSLWIYPWMVTMRESLYPNVSLIYGVPSAIGYTPLLPQLTSDYLDDMSAPMLNLLNVRYYVRPQMLPTDAKTEGDDLDNQFAPPFFQYTSFPATSATRIKVISSLSQSVGFREGQVVAQIRVFAQDGSWQTFPLRVGRDTAEWAYERNDVRSAIKFAMPPIATTYPARSAFPTESHLGHNYLGQFDVTRDGKPVSLVGMIIMPEIPEGLLHIEKVGFVASDGKEVSLAKLTGYTDQSLIYRTNEVAVFENHDILPRAFLVHSAHRADDQAALKELRGNDFKPLTELILADGDPIKAGDAQREDEFVRIVSYEPERAILSVHASVDGYLLITDAWFPGWRVRVDGVESTINRADLIFRAVRTSPGDHRVEFYYQPMWLYVGAGISLIALALLGVIIARTRR
jgi:hypothetical protein